VSILPMKNGPHLPTLLQSADEHIAFERARQIIEEGFSASRDDGYVRGELSTAAHCYLLGNCAHWPWPIEWWKPGDHTAEDRVRQLTKAGALIRADRERLARLEKTVTGALERTIKQARDMQDARAR
jgi:hypothetical protein